MVVTVSREQNNKTEAHDSGLYLRKGYSKEMAIAILFYQEFLFWMNLQVLHKSEL